MRCACAYIYVCVCACAHIHIYIDIHTHIIYRYMYNIYICTHLRVCYAYLWCHPCAVRRWSARSSESFGTSPWVGSSAVSWAGWGLLDQQFIEVKVILLFFCSLFGSQKPRQIPGQNIMCGFNSPPSQSQLHLQWIVLPLLPLNRSSHGYSSRCFPSLSMCVPM